MKMQEKVYQKVMEDNVSCEIQGRFRLGVCM